MVSRILFSSAKEEWETPHDFYDKVYKNYEFTLDVAASKENAKCDKYYTKEENGLIQPWNGRIWCNPPYGRNVGVWIEKAYNESRYNSQCELCVFLLPARTDTMWFHTWIYKKLNVEIDFIKGRLKFGGMSDAAPFPSMLVTFYGHDAK